jgi:hypothetical protein
LLTLGGTGSYLIMQKRNKPAQSDIANPLSTDFRKKRAEWKLTLVELLQGFCKNDRID